MLDGGSHGDLRMELELAQAMGSCSTADCPTDEDAALADSPPRLVEAGSQPAEGSRGAGCGSGAAGAGAGRGTVLGCSSSFSAAAAAAASASASGGLSLIHI